MEEEIEEEVAEDMSQSLPRKPEMESDSEGVVMEPEGDIRKSLTLRMVSVHDCLYTLTYNQPSVPALKQTTCTFLLPQHKYRLIIH